MLPKGLSTALRSAALCALLAASPALAQVNELIISQGIDTPGFDPHGHNTGAVEAIHTNMMDYLLMRDASGQIQPALAVSWEQVSDTAMRFHLREGVLFHDGTTLTAEDVKFSLERPALDSSVYVHSFYETIAEVEVINDLEFIIHTTEPDPILLNRISRNGSGIVPKAYVEEVGWEGYSVAPIGTGPFKFVEWRRDDRIIMEAFDDHWRGRPAWDRLVHRTIPEDSTRVGELISGGVHIATNVPSQDVARIEASGVAGTEPWPSLRVMELFVNMSEGSPLADPLVREAIDLAIDNQMLIDAVMDGAGTPVRGGVAPAIDASPMDLYDTYLYDAERAVELLAEAGYGPGELTIKLQGPSGRYPMDVEVMEVTAVMLGQVGINVEIEALEWSAFQDRIWLANNVEGLALIAHANSLQDGFHAVQRARCGFEYSNVTGWCDPEFDELVNLSAGALDPDERASYLSDAYHMLTESRSILYLFQLDNIIGISNDVDWEPTPDERLWMFDSRPAE